MIANSMVAKHTATIRAHTKLHLKKLNTRKYLAQ